MVRRYEMTHRQCALIKGLLPENGRRGGRWDGHRITLDGIFRPLHTGARWREVPERYGEWKSAYDRFNGWREGGTIDRILERLHLRLDERGRIDADLRCVDATSIRAGRSTAGARRGRRGAGRAGRPRPGPLPRRVRHRAAPDRRRPWHPPGRPGHTGPGARVDGAGTGAGGGAAEASEPGPAATPAEAAGRGQGL
jgi:transposase